MKKIVKKITIESFYETYKNKMDTFIGKGTRGVVSKSNEIATKRTKPESLSEYYREVNALTNLQRSSYVVNIVKFTQSNISMTLMEGTLQDHPDYLNINVLTKHLLEGLNFIHSMGYIHCDIKSENILVGNGEVVYADFGLAIYLPIGKKLISTTITYGLHMDEYVDHKADVWSLGIMLYGLVTGRDLIEEDDDDMQEIIDAFPKRLRVLEKSTKISDHTKYLILNMLTIQNEERPYAHELLGMLFSHRKYLPKINTVEKTHLPLIEACIGKTNAFVIFNALSMVNIHPRLDFASCLVISSYLQTYDYRLPDNFMGANHNKMNKVLETFGGNVSLVNADSVLVDIFYPLLNAFTIDYFRKMVI